MIRRRERRTHEILSALLGCLALSAAAFAATVVDPSATDAVEAAKPPRGIRGYGPGAVLVKRAIGVAGEPGSSASRTPGIALKISGASMAGAVNSFALTPDGATAVYIADQETVGRYELYSVPVDGSAAPTKISAGLPFGTGDTGVALFQISPNGSQVVFLADPNLGGGNNEVFSVPINASTTPQRLNTAAQAPVAAVGIAPNGTTVAFFAPATATGSGPSEVYRATVGAAGSGVQLSDASVTIAAGEVVAADFSANSARLLYAADATTDGVFQWHSVALSASAPGTDIKLSSALNFVSLGAITPNGATLVYAADETLSFVMELYSIPLAGGTKRKLNPSMAGTGVTSLRLSADSQRVAYLADQLTSGVVEVFGAGVLAAGSGVRLNTPLSGIQSADVVTFGPDSMTVLYEADENAAGTHDLMSAPATAAAAPLTLDALTVPSNAGYFSGLGTPVIGRRAVYPVVASGVTNLFSVRYDASGGLTRVNDMLAAGESVRDAFAPTAATRMMAYGVGSGGVTKKLYVGAIRSDFTPEQVNQTAAAGSLGVLGYEISADEVHAVYLQDQAVSGKPELYSRELDSDQDTVGNALDTCPFFPNLGQASVPFFQTVLAVDDRTFVWNNAQDIRYVRGPLASVSALTVDLTGTLIEAASFTDVSTPSSGAGYYYLFALDCAGRSYQTALGAEPNRDAAGLP